jgi:pyridoxine 5-phosphate synthase
MTRLSVNINKVATLRNARGGTVPNVVQFAKDCEEFGAEGITVHPRPDERHIRYQDVLDLKKVVTTEFNIEGYPDQRFMDLVLKVKPEQATLVPDPPGVLTSNTGWDTISHADFLKDIISTLKLAGIRTSIFLNAEPRLVESAAQTGTDRIELYTGPYAEHYSQGREEAIKPYIETAQEALKRGLLINAGHDLNLENLRYFKEHIPGLEEVSIGHAIISDALYYGIANVIQMYKRLLK